MIVFAMVDKMVKEPEYSFLLGVASQLGIDKETFDGLFTVKTKKIIPKSQSARILQFHRLLLLMNVDKVQHMAETEKLFNIGLGMGLPPSAIEQVLYVMHQYPDKIIPPKVLIDIFKAHNN